MTRKKNPKKPDDNNQKSDTQKRKLRFLDKFWKEFHKATEDKQNRIKDTFKTIVEDGFTPGMNLRPLPQDKSIKYLKAAKDLYITVNIEYKDNVQIITVRCIRNHDTLKLNP